MSQEELHNLIIYQNRYFEILKEFFVNVTGCLPKDFATVDDFSESIQKMAKELQENTQRAEKSINAFSDLEDKLKELYSTEGGLAFKSAKNLDACKLNLGGSSRFLKTQLNATRRSLLYSDTVLIPDPVMPWLEKIERKSNSNISCLFKWLFSFYIYQTLLVMSSISLPSLYSLALKKA